MKVFRKQALILHPVPAEILYHLLLSESLRPKR